MEELALLRKSGVEQLVDWINKAEGRIDGLGFLLLFVIDALPEEQFKAIDENITNYLQDLRSEEPPSPPTDEASEAVRTSFIQTLEQAQSILRTARADGKPGDLGSGATKRKLRLLDAISMGNAAKNLWEVLTKIDAGG